MIKRRHSGRSTTSAARSRNARCRGETTATHQVSRLTGGIATLITAKLVDEVDKELVMHDWDEWQRWRAEDANDDATPPDHPPNGRANDSRTTREEHRNGSAIRVSAEGDTETEKELLPSLRSGEPRLRVVGEPAPKPTPKRRRSACSSTRSGHSTPLWRSSATVALSARSSKKTPTPTSTSSPRPTCRSTTASGPARRCCARAGPWPG
jgi:hypothetical protein